MKIQVSTILTCLASVACAIPVLTGAGVSERSPDTDASNKSSTCHNPLVRKEWRKLNIKEQVSYLVAVQCLAKLPSISKGLIPAAVSIFDDFQGVHVNQTDDIHWVGHFPLWHRYYVNTYEKALREKCGYIGAQPYWDWIEDTESGKDMKDWPIFASPIGFGGNGPYISLNATENPFGIPGRTGGGCVQDGPFTYDKFRISIGPAHDIFTKNVHCLARDFSPVIASTNLLRSVWDDVRSQPDYGRFERRLEALPSFNMTNVHGGGHCGALGTMGDAYNSPGDPVFYLHHANLDRLYWKWQQEDLNRRLSDVSGNIVAFDYNNTIAGNITLDFKVNLGNLAPPIALKELTNTEGDTLCYTYDR